MVKNYTPAQIRQAVNTKQLNTIIGKLKGYGVKATRLLRNEMFQYGVDVAKSAQERCPIGYDSPPEKYHPENLKNSAFVIGYRKQYNKDRAFNGTIDADRQAISDAMQEVRNDKEHNTFVVGFTADYFLPVHERQVNHKVGEANFLLNAWNEYANRPKEIEAKIKALKP
jgi:hypothetical protein